MDGATATVGGVFENFQIHSAIIVSEEALLPVVSTLCNVLWSVWQVQAPWSGHELDVRKGMLIMLNALMLENGRSLKTVWDIGSDPFSNCANHPFAEFRQLAYVNVTIRT
jgi:hypothetical protein